MNKILEFVKANKRGIAKKALIVAGAAVGLLVVANAVRSKDDAEYEDTALLEVAGTEEASEVVESEPEL